MTRHCCGSIFWTPCTYNLIRLLGTWRISSYCHSVTVDGDWQFVWAPSGGRGVIHRVSTTHRPMTIVLDLTALRRRRVGRNRTMLSYREGCSSSCVQHTLRWPAPDVAATAACSRRRNWIRRSVPTVRNRSSTVTRGINTAPRTTHRTAGFCSGRRGSGGSRHAARQRIPAPILTDQYKHSVQFTPRDVNWSP